MNGTNNVKTSDGGSMPAYVALPSDGRGPGIVVLQEIFGITDYMKRRARDLADLGYIALIPDLYWRIGSNVSIDETTQQGLQEAFGYLQRLDQARAVQDAIDAIEMLRSLDETGGRAGVFGFCMGGRLAYMVGVQDEPDVVVSYYGSGIGEQLQDAPRLACPVIFHFGTADNYLPVQEAEQIRGAFAQHPNAEVHMHEGAGHAFDNPSPMFHHAGASAAAWPLTTAFLLRQLPPTAASS